MCSEECRKQRRSLYEDAYLTDGEGFDTVVAEHRTLTTEVHMERAVNEDG
jgi:hypothetical protein